MKSLIATSILFSAALVAEDPAKEQHSCPMHEKHMTAANAKEAAAKNRLYKRMNERGEAPSGMNFSQFETTHHFIRDEAGGHIEVTANDPNDTKLIQTVREHLQHIADSFTARDFSIPQFVHGERPAGTDEMVRLGDRISYRYEEIPNGARVVIRTKDQAALAAVHSFLSYQVAEHRTGDSSESPQHSH